MGNSTTASSTPTPQPTLDDLNAQIKALQRGIAIDSNSLSLYSDPNRSAPVKAAIVKQQTQLDALEAQKAQLYPDATP